MKRPLAVACALAASTVLAALPFKDGDRIAFLGDSITQLGTDNPRGWVNLVERAIRAQSPEVSFVHAGVSGDKSSQMIVRYDNDVSRRSPTWMFFSCGVNDAPNGLTGRSRNRGLPLAAYKANVETVLDWAKEDGTQVIVLSQTPVLETPVDHVANRNLVAYNAVLKEAALARGLVYLDPGEAIRAAISKKSAKDKDRLVYTCDGTHPNDKGNAIIARTVLAGLERAAAAAAEELRKQVRAISAELNVARAKAGDGEAALALFDRILALPLPPEDRRSWLEQKAAFQQHALRQVERAKPLWLEAIAIREAQLAGKTGLDRANALCGIEQIRRRQLQDREASNRIAAERIALYKAAFRTAEGAARLRLRNDVRQAMIDMNRGRENDETRAWDVETRAAAKEIVTELAELPDARWLKEAQPLLFIEALRSDETGRRVALEKVCDRMMSIPDEVKGAQGAKRGLAGHAANLARSCTTEELRLKAAEYYRTVGDAFRLGETLYWVNRDLAGARAAFASLPNDPKAQGYLAMLADEPTLSWQIDYARQELTNWVTKISGKAPDLTKFVLGTPVTSAEAAAFAKRHADDFRRLKGNDGFIIAEEKDTVFVVADRSKGVLNGVYRFLEKNSDIIWVRETEGDDGFGTVYTKDPAFRNKVTYLCDVPDTCYHYWTANARVPSLRWQARLLNNCGFGYDGNMYPERYRAYATYMDGTSSDVKLSLEIVDRYKATDPDVFPLVAGKRRMEHDHQLCFMNPKTVELFAREAARILRGLPKRANEISFGLGDNWNVCECEEWCRKPIRTPDGKTVTIAEENFRSTQYAMFENAVYLKLKEEFPCLKAPTAPAYIFTAQAPAVKVLGGGGCYCPYVKNHKKPVYDDAVNASWHKIAEDFRQAGMPFSGLYEYYLCDSTPQFYHATMEIMQKDLAYYGSALDSVYLDGGYADGYLGLEGNGQGAVYEASAIEFWVASRLMWNHKTDLKAARREFCRRAYHGAADIMAGYYEKLAKNYNDDPAGCFWNDDPVIAAKHYIVEKDLAPWLRETLAKAEAAATDPRSKELIRRHRVHMEWLVGLAEKSPKKVTLEVEPDWTPVTPLTKISDANAPSDGRTKMWVKNDKRNLYLKVETRNADWRKLYDGFVKDGTYGKMQDSKRVFDWCNCIELFLDGGLAQSGGYYHFGLSFDARRRTGIGSGGSTDAVKWRGDIEPIEGGLRIVVTWPLEDIGVDISKGNKVGAMFLVNGTAWNGGQWHSPAGFQTLQLNMK